MTFELLWNFEAECIPPANDPWSNAQILPADGEPVIGTTACATSELVPTASPPAVWYSFTPIGPGITQFFIDADGLVINMEVFTGPDLAHLKGPIASYSSDDPNLPMTVAMDHVAVQPYWIRVYHDI